MKKIVHIIKPISYHEFKGKLRGALPEIFVSIIVPIYRTEKYLKECLDSIQCQTLTDFEVILVNDASPDKAMSIAHGFTQKDQRFKIVEHAINKGLGAARNTGIDYAIGEYLFFLDSDDLLPYDALEKLYNLAVLHDADIVVGNMAWKSLAGIEPVKYISSRIMDWEKLGLENLRSLPARYLASGSACHKIFRRDLLLSKYIRFSEGIYWEDVTFSIESWMVSRIIIFTSCIVYYRRYRKDLHNLSITQSINKKHLTDRDKIVHDVFKLLVKHIDQIPDIFSYGVFAFWEVLHPSFNIIKKLETLKLSSFWLVWFPWHYSKVFLMFLKFIYIFVSRNRINQKLRKG